MYCKYCGSEIDDRAVICPKCGVATSEVQIQNSVEQKTNTLAIVGFVLSFVVAIAGLICSVIARKQIKQSGEGGMGLATAGMIISIVELSLSVLLSIIYMCIFFAALGI